VRKFVINQVLGIAAFNRKYSQSKGVDSRRNQSIQMQWRSYPLDLVDKSRGGTLLEGGKM